MGEHLEAEDGTVGEKCPRILPNMTTSTVHLEIFYMSQSYDMGPTALLSLRRKACREFFCPENPTTSAGCEPANLGTKGQHATSRPPKPRLILHTYPPMKMEQTECSETLAYKIQTSGNYPEESIQHSEQSESLKSRIILHVFQRIHFTILFTKHA